MSVTTRSNDIYITKRDTLSFTIKEKVDGVYVEKVFSATAKVTMFIWDTANMQTILFQKSFTPDGSGYITITLDPTENALVYGTYFYSLLQTATDSDYRNTLIPEAGETCDIPKYIVCRGDGDVSV